MREFLFQTVAYPALLRAAEGGGGTGKTVASVDIPARKPAGAAVETVVSSGRGTVVDAGGAAREGGAASTYEDIDRELDEGLADEDETATGTAEDSPGGDTGEGTDLSEDGADDETAGLEDLGEFTPDDPEVVAKFDKRYTTETGQLNTAQIGTEFWGNYQKALAEAGDKAGEVKPTGHMPAGFYSWAKETFQVDDAFIQQFEEGQVLRTQRAEQEVFERVGGPENLSKALTWAREGGYTKDQQAAFNKLSKEKAGSPEYLDALDLLMVRASRAGAASLTTGAGKKPDPEQRGPGRRRRGVPQRDATGSAAPGGGTGGEVFETQKAMDDALGAARRAIKDASPKDRAKAEAEYQKTRAKAQRTLNLRKPKA